MKPILFTAILVVIGITLFVHSYKYPLYTNAAAVNELNQTWPDAKGNQSRAHANEAIQTYYRERAKYETPRPHLFDEGLGFISFGLSLAVLLHFCGIKQFRDFHHLQTAKSARTIWLLAVSGCLLFIPAEFIYYVRTEWRGDYPPFADSIGIPIFGTICYCLIGLVFIWIFWLLVLRDTQLPCPFWIKPRVAGLKYWMWFVLIGLLLILSACILFVAIQSGDAVAIPSCLLSFYLLFSARAIIASKC